MQSFGDNHLLIFDVPSANEDEELLNAELRVLTIVEINSRQLVGTYWNRALVFFINIGTYAERIQKISFA